MKSKYIIPIFVPHKGCPNKCTFCNQKKISGQIKELEGTDVEKIIEDYLSINTDVQPQDIEIAFYGGSFTGIDKAKQIELLTVAKKYIDSGKIDSIRLSTRPDYITQEILDYLKEYGVKTIELGVQSLDDHVLQESKRGHSAQDVYDASKLIKENKFVLGLQMMVGLKDSNEQKEIDTANKIIEIGPQIVRIYPVLVIKDTELEEQFYNGEYVPCGLEKAIEISAKLLKSFTLHDITVIRIGLQTTDNINEGKDVVAGPFHPAFGELVKQRLVRNDIEQYIRENDLKNISLNIKCDSKLTSKVVGNKKANIQYFNDTYNIEIKINDDTNSEYTYIVKEIY